jgi:uncharacterized protein YcbK (DUF882 family)
VPFGKTRSHIRRLSASRVGYSCGLALLAFLFGSKSLQNAVAEGDTRTITMHHLHTDEDITITFKRDGRYDDAALEKLNWFLRDWRRGEQTKMDPHLIDLIWEVQREAGGKEPIQVVCGYRSPQTNAMLRHRSAGVARFSQHMLGHAMDFYVPGVPLAELRAIGLRLQRGGVGFYPTSGSPFVHMDTASIRMWPRMSRQELVRVFPDQRTVHIPSDGRPLAGYAMALADIAKRGDSSPSGNSIDATRKAGVDVSGAAANAEHSNKGLFAKLLGLKTDDDDEEGDAAPAPSTGVAAKAKAVVAAAVEKGAEKKAAVVAAVEKGVEKVEKKAASARATIAALPKMIKTASAATPPETATAQSLTSATATPAPAAPASAADPSSANRVIVDRGYWKGPVDAPPASQAAPSTPAQASAAPRPRRTDVASADPNATGALSQFTNGSDDHASPELALSYAAQPEQPVARPTVAVTQTSVTGSTTVAAKGVVGRAASAIHAAGEKLATVVKVSVNFQNPWVRAVVLSPSVHQFLTTVALGVRDFRSLASMMLKPSSSVVMTFADDPNPGLEHDHFSGDAVVFISTVNYPAKTAALQ